VSHSVQSGYIEYAESERDYRLRYRNQPVPSGRTAGQCCSFKVVIPKFYASLGKPAMSTTLTVEGMSCGHCEQTVEEAIEALTGVQNAEADRDTEQVTVVGDASPEQLIAAVEDAGYDAGP